jgi:hypothetical protein
METNALQSTSSQSKPSNRFNLLTTEETNQEIFTLSEKFQYYMHTLDHKFIILTNPKEKMVCSKRASYSSRYTKTGIKKIKDKVRKRLSAYKATFGIMLTLTIADNEHEQKSYQGMLQLDAWEQINKLGREFTDELNKWRKRHNLKKVRAYVKVLEIQPGRYYPHLHIYCPGLKWLAPIRMMQKLWPWSNVDITTTDSTAPGDYITKYLSKMEGKDFFNLMLFSFNLRMYSNSRGLKYSPEIHEDKGWRYSSAGTQRASEDGIDQFIKAGYILVGQPLMEPRSP